MYDGKREAVDAARAREREWRRVRKGGVTVREYRDKLWRRNHEERRLEQTWSKYWQDTDQFLRYFGDRPLSSISPLEARAWATGGITRDGQEFPRHKHVMSSARAMFSDARRDGLIDISPFDRLGVDTKAVRNTIAIPELTLAALVEAAKSVWGAYGRVFGAMILFAAYTAMRPGKLFALRPSHVRFEDGRIEIVDAWNQKLGRFTKPKMSHDHEVVLFPEAAAALRSLPAPVDDGYWFTTQDGVHFRQPSLHYYWNPVRVTVGLANMDFYELRHFCATLMADMGFSAQDIARQLGHRDNGAIARQHYMKQDADRQLSRIRRQWIERVEKLRATMPRPNPPATALGQTPDNLDEATGL